MSEQTDYLDPSEKTDSADPSVKADYPDPRANLIEDLLFRQDDVIQQLDDLEKRLIATIEEIRPAKVEVSTDQSLDQAVKKAA